MSIYKQYLEIIKQVKVVGKDATNPFAKSKYASLTNILNKLQPLLNDAGLVFKIDVTELQEFKSESVQETTEKEGKVTTKTFQQTSGYYKVKVQLLDVEEEDDKEGFMDWEFVVPHDSTQKNPTQGFGSTMTYIQRYAYAMVFQIPFDDQDPDASKTGTNAQPSTAQTNGQAGDDKPWLNEDTPEFAEAVKYMDGGGTVKKIREKYRVSKKTESILTKS